jgi:hypothetical protein
MEGYAIENCFEISGKEFAEEGHFIEMRRHLSDSQPSALGHFYFT